jgi:lipopolysaccharide transport system permease protein
MRKPVPMTAPYSVLDLRADMSVATRIRLAATDLQEGLRLWRLSWSLGWLDIRLRYRGSMLGPFWLTISTAVMVAAQGVLYATLFKMELRNYLPFLALSQILWALLAAVVSEACSSFTDAEGVIRSMRMPFFVFACRVMLRNFIALAHNVVVIVVVMIWFRIWPGLDALAAIPGLALWLVDGLMLTLALGAFCARFRDIQPIVNSIMQIMFFVTPVIWKPEQLGAAASLLPWNPFYDVLAVVRDPLLGVPVSDVTYLAAIGYSILLCLLSWAFFIRARSRITFWI